MIDPTSDPRKFLTELFHIAVKEADPMKVIPRNLPPRPSGRLVVIGAGKASARMAEAVESVYGPCEGLVITRYGYARPCKGIEIVEAAHPVPDQAGFDATRRMVELVRDLGPDDTVLALISGGGSALLCAPIKGLTLADMQAVNAALLSSGAPISEMNVVRTHLCDLKGGGLASACAPARVLSLLISDVPGDDPAEIASGPTVPVESSPDRALEILERWNVDTPDHVPKLIRQQSSSSKLQQPMQRVNEVRLVAAPSQSLSAAKAEAESQGYKVRILGDTIEGEARSIGEEQAREAMLRQSLMAPGDRPLLLLSGGECTVTRTGTGVGGPNAEFTLAALLTLHGHAGIHVLACDTDGIDGAAEIAGAYAGPTTIGDEEKSRAFAETALAGNDAHNFFQKVGGQIVSGPTLTNVNDFRALLIFPAVALTN